MQFHVSQRGWYHRVTLWLVPQSYSMVGTTELLYGWYHRVTLWLVPQSYSMVGTTELLYGWYHRVTLWLVLRESGCRTLDTQLLWFLSEISILFIQLNCPNICVHSTFMISVSLSLTTDWLSNMFCNCPQVIHR